MDADNAHVRSNAFYHDCFGICITYLTYDRLLAAIDVRFDRHGLPNQEPLRFMRGHTSHGRWLAISGKCYGVLRVHDARSAMTDVADIILPTDKVFKLGQKRWTIGPPPPQEPDNMVELCVYRSRLGTEQKCTPIRQLGVQP